MKKNISYTYVLLSFAALAAMEQQPAPTPVRLPLSVEKIEKTLQEEFLLQLPAVKRSLQFERTIESLCSRLASDTILTISSGKTSSFMGPIGADIAAKFAGRFDNVNKYWDIWGPETRANDLMAMDKHAYSAADEVIIDILATLRDVIVDYQENWHRPITIKRCSRMVMTINCLSFYRSYVPGKEVQDYAQACHYITRVLGTICNPEGSEKINEIILCCQNEDERTIQVCAEFEIAFDTPPLSSDLAQSIAITDSNSDSEPEQQHIVKKRRKE